MLIGIFKSNQKVVNVLTIVLTFALWIPSFFLDLETEFFHIISTHIKWLDILMAISLIAVQAIYLNFIVSEYKIVKDNSHLTSLMFLLFNSSALWLLHLNQIIISNTFILIAFHQLIKMYNLKNNYTILFNASFLIAIASLIYLPSIVYFALLWIALIYTTTPKWRDFIISLIGLIVPILYFIVYQLVFGNFSQFNISNYSVVVFDIHWSGLTFFQEFFFISFFVISLFAFVGLFSTINRSVVRTKKMLVIVLLMVIVSLGTLLLNSFDYIATFIIISIPMAILVANFFQNLKKTWLAEVLFLILLAGVIFSYFS